MAKKAQLDEKDLQQKYLELQMLSAQIKQLQKAAALLDEQAQEIAIVTEGLDELKKVGKGNEILVPISSGIFAKGELKESSELIVSVGSNVAVAKTSEDTKKLLQERFVEIGREKDEIFIQLQGLVQVAQEYQEIIEKAASEMENAKAQQ